MPDPDPHEIAAVLKTVVLECADPRKLRAFVGSFVSMVTVLNGEVAVEYLPDCLMRLNDGQMGFTVRMFGSPF